MFLDLFNCFLNRRGRGQSLTFETPCQIHCLKGTFEKAQNVNLSKSTCTWAPPLSMEQSHYCTMHNFFESWTEARTFRGRCVLGLKRREVEQEITGVYHPPLLPSASLPVRLGGFGRHWRRADLIREEDKSGVCGLRRRVFLDIQMHACMHAGMHACMHACMHWWLGAPPDQLLLSSPPSQKMT